MGKDVTDPTGDTVDGDDKASRTALDKAIDVLGSFEGGGLSRSLMQIAETTDLPKSTAHRLLATLIAHGLVDRSGSRYVLGSRMFVLGNQVPFCRQRQLRDVAKPFLCDLHSQTKQNVHLATLEDDRILYLEKLSLFRQLLPSAVGAQLPGYHTALGKTLMSYAEEDQIDEYLDKPLTALTRWTITDPARIKRELRASRVAGYATDSSETMMGLSCVAVPVFSPASRRPIAALSVSVLGASSPPTQHLLQARTTARNIEAALQVAGTS